MKLNRKWVLVIALLVSLTMATASTLAFLTDRDSEANVFTVGNVEIDLKEEFEQESTLMPGQDIEKIPTITNTGDNDAWVWMTIAVPAYLDDVGSAANNIVHWNWMGGTVSDTMGTAPSITQDKLDTYKENGWLDEDVTLEDIQNGKYWIGGDGSASYVGTQEIEGAEYNVYVYKYNSILEPGEETLAGPLVKVYMDERVDIDPEGNVCLIENGVATKTDWNINDTDKPIIYVSAYAMQAEGFADVNAAYDAYAKQWTTTNGVNNGLEWGTPGEVGMPTTSWSDNADTSWYDASGTSFTISSAEELAGLAVLVNEDSVSFSGKTVTLTADVNMGDHMWTPIGQTGHGQFQGTFDGGNKTISNLYIDSTAETGAHYSSGLFGWLNHANVVDVNVKNAIVSGNHNVGVIAGYMETSGCTISGCTVTKATVTGKHANDDACGDKVGVIVGHAGNAGVLVENCSASDCSVVAGRDAGQIVGAAKPANVVGCTATDVTVEAGGDCTGANINEAVIGRAL